MNFVQSVVNNGLSMLTRKRLDELYRNPPAKSSMSEYEDMKPLTYDGRLSRIPGLDKRVDKWNDLVGEGGCSYCK